ncbi:MAG: DUF4919 domain-containing protein [Alistipes sp.]|nr:DUF4919 domain-containing protein [Alistipes sp.]
MNRAVAILLSLFVAVSAFAATPDNDRIFAAINDVNSPFYYPNLMLRYKEGKPMSEEEYHHLYYGYAFQPSYKPLDANPSMTRVQEIMARISIDTPSVHDIDELIAAGIAAMEQDPFSPTLINILVYAYGASGDKVRELAYSEHLRGILKTIEQSGDGLKEKSPMHIIMFSHGTDYIASKNIGYRKGQIMSRTVEFVPFAAPQNRVKGYYFDYSRVYWNKPENYTFKRERTWQFNNLKPREYK